MNTDYANSDFEDSLRILTEGDTTVLRSEETSLSIVTFEKFAPTYIFRFGNAEVYDPVTQIRTQIQKRGDGLANESFVFVDFEAKAITGRFARVVNLSSYTLYPFIRVALQFPDQYICLHTAEGIEAGTTKDDMNLISKGFGARTQFSAGGVWGVTNLSNTAPPSPPWNQCTLRT